MQKDTTCLRKQGGRAKYAVLLILLIILGSFISLSISKISSGMEQQFQLELFFDSIFHYDYRNIQHYIIRDIQIPRVIGAIAVGCFLAVGGSIMQSVTRNYLADPSIVGVNSGATLGLTLGYLLMQGNTSYNENVFFSIMGAMGASLFIFILSPMLRGNDSKIKLLLVGSAVSMLLSSIASTIAFRAMLGEQLRMWSDGGLTGIKWGGVGVLALGLVGVLIGLLFAKEFTILSMGDEVAASLGTNVKLVKIVGILAVSVLSGVVVSVVGGIGFIGFMIPNISKMLCGGDFRKAMPVSALMGSAFMLYADIISRTINYPFETPIGSITSVIAIPFFLYLVNSKKARMIDGAK